eukprot:5797821-Amphidinium_carterae.1
MRSLAVVSRLTSERKEIENNNCSHSYVHGPRVNPIERWTYDNICGQAKLAQEGSVWALPITRYAC